MAQTRLEELSPVVKKINVEVDPETVQKELDKAYAHLARTVKLKGFRPGHAPRRLVEQYFHGQVEGDVAKQLVETTLGDALLEHKLAPLDLRVMEQDAVEKGKAFKYVARAEVRPKIVPRDYKGLEVQHTPSAVAEERVSAGLEKMREAMATLVPVEGREVAEAGDVAIVDYLGTIDGAPLRGGERTDVGVTVEPGSFLDGKCEALLGAKLGESREAAASFPVDYPAQDLRGKEGRFKVSLKGLKRREIPALDDELAKDIGEKSLADLRARVRQDLEARENEKSDTQLRDTLLKALLEKNPVEAPPALVERTVDAMAEGMLEGLARRGVDPRRLGMDVDHLRAGLKDRAELEVRGGFLLDAIADAESLEPTDADVDAAIHKAVAESGQPEAKVRAQYKKRENLDALRTKLRQDKALALVKAAATLKSA